MRIAVTGGCGFIGSHVVDHLIRAGHDVAVLDVGRRWLNPAAEYRHADIFDESALAATMTGADAAFHLAGAADVNDVAADPVHAVRLNVEGTTRVLAAAVRAGVGRFVLASTVWVYGAASGPAQSRPRVRRHKAGGRADRAQLPGDVRAALHDLALRHPVWPAHARCP